MLIYATACPIMSILGFLFNCEKTLPVCSQEDKIRYTDEYAQIIY